MISSDIFDRRLAGFDLRDQLTFELGFELSTNLSHYEYQFCGGFSKYLVEIINKAAEGDLCRFSTALAPADFGERPRRFVGSLSRSACANLGGKTLQSMGRSQVALEAIKRTAQECGSIYGVYPHTMHDVEEAVAGRGSRSFHAGRDSGQGSIEEEKADLYEQIGRLPMELDWLQKIWDLATRSKRRECIEPITVD